MLRSTRLFACAYACALVACDPAPETKAEPQAKAEASKPAKAAPNQKKTEKPPQEAPKAAKDAKAPPEKPPIKGSLAASAHRAPKGTIAGKPFAPDTVLLLDNSDGGQLLFIQSDEGRERWRCEEQLNDTAFEISLYRPIAEWVVNTPVETELRSWGVGGFDAPSDPAGTVRVVLSKKDPKTFALAGKIELAAADGTWKFAGDFVGEYCPTKAKERETAEPLAGLPWGLDAVAPDTLPKDKLASVTAGNAQPIAHVNAREVERDGKTFTEFLFFTETPPDPCAPRPESSGLTTYANDGSIAMRDVAPFRIDNFRIALAGVIAKGDRLAGNYDGREADARTQIADADLQVFEPDGYRSWRYWQYYSVALAVDDLTDERISARVYLAVPDEGKSMLVGAFEAQRCR